MKTIVVILSVAFATTAFSQETPQAPQVETQQQSDGGLKAEQKGDPQQKAADSAAPVIPTVHSEGGDGKREGKTNEDSEEGTEFWAPLWGYRLKITDTLLVAFTFLLFVATLALWWATRRLVKGADKTAESQLRAYISVNPTEVLNWRHKSNLLAVRFEIENHGQTIGFEICYSFAMGIFDAPLPNNHVFADPNRQFDQNNSLFPRAKTQVWLFYERILTDAEMTSIESGKRFHTWGVMTYRDAFQQLRTTRFSFSFGGPDFARSMKKVPGAAWNWHNGQYHNDAT